MNEIKRIAILHELKAIKSKTTLLKEEINALKLALASLIDYMEGERQDSLKDMIEHCCIALNTNRGEE